MSSRRNFIRQAALISASLTGGLSACSPAISRRFVRENFIDTDKLSLFPKPKISHGLVVKETVGLRPYRKNGFRLETEMRGAKVIVHNYVHGGSGWSLSWGCADLVKQELNKTSARNIGIIGSGVSGLTTARTLQDAGYQVNIYTKALPPDVTSNKATGTWSPGFMMIDDDLITADFRSRWESAARFSYKRYQNLLGQNDIVTWMDEYVISDDLSHAGGAAHGSPLNLDQILPKPVILEKSQHPFGVDRVLKQPSLVFNIPSYLNRLMDQFLAFGGKVSIREFSDSAELDSLPESHLVNCTGLGSYKLFKDENMVPVAGQLSFLIPQPGFNYRITTDNGYIIPRKDGIVLGGNVIRGSWDENPNPGQTEKILNNLIEVVSKMRV
jgi:D-amino-acid oxidase